MSSSYLPRSRRAAWCFLVATSASTVYYFGSAERTDPILNSDLIMPGSNEEQVGLFPTLLNAYELPPLKSAGLSPEQTSSPAKWNPDPEWKKEIVGSLEDRAVASTANIGKLSPIPEDYPIKPRLKNEPPVIGDALAKSFPTPIQRQSLRQPSTQPVSPFMAKPVFPATNSNVASSTLGSPTNPNVAQQPAWPDQNYSQRLTAANATVPNELTTPHVLTGTVIRPQVALETRPATMPEQINPVRPSTLPPTGNYIRQPVRRAN